MSNSWEKVGNFNDKIEPLFFNEKETEKVEEESSNVKSEEANINQFFWEKYLSGLEKDYVEKLPELNVRKIIIKELGD